MLVRTCGGALLFERLIRTWQAIRANVVEGANATLEVAFEGVEILLGCFLDLELFGLATRILTRTSFCSL